MNNRILTKRNSCRLCNNKSLDIAFSLKPTPPANAFRNQKDIKDKQRKFPLNLMLCPHCGHAQLREILDPKLLFENYVYVSGTSASFVKHFEKYANRIISKYKLKENSLIVEIGSNDGTLLKFFKDKKYRVIGIDPAKKIAKQASQEGIQTIPSFFNDKISDKIIKKEGCANVIIANNVYAHVDNLRSLTLAIRKLLHDNGIFVFEVSYLLDVYKKTLFDTIYHEHLSYHAAKPLVQFFESLNMNLFDIERVNTHGGSIRCFVQKHTGKKKTKMSVKNIVRNENRNKIFTLSTFHDFSVSIDGLKNDLNILIKEIRRKGMKLAGFGAPAKATTLMHHFNISRQDIEYIVDDSPLKQNLFTPGYNIPVVSSKYLEKNPVDYLLILAWNFYDSIIEKQIDFSRNGGKFIVPLPKLKVI